MAKYKNLVDEMRRKRLSGEVSVEKIEEQKIVIPDIKNDETDNIQPVVKKRRGRKK